MADQPNKIRIFYVDDNNHVAEALRIKLTRDGLFEWGGWISSADTLVQAAAEARPSVVVVDLDMPGLSPFDAIQALSVSQPEVRVVIFSGHVHADFIEQALNAGVWGYASKNDGEEELVKILRAVAAGHVSLSPEAHSAFRG